MEIRKYKPGEEHAIWDIFYNSIHQINVQDYTQKQIEAWAPSDLDESIWSKKIIDINPYAVLENGIISAYANLQEDGYIDHFFCHHKYQRQGIGSFLYSRIEKIVVSNGIPQLRSDVSITAKPFFESKGFVVSKKQLLIMRGQELTYYKMLRSLDHN